MKVENFENAFRTDTSGCIRTCACGTIYYSPYPAWDFEEGELEELIESTATVSLDYSVETISFEGAEYVCDCNCWHERAKQIMNFLDSHMRGIAEYFKLEKQRIQREADGIPEMQEPTDG